MPTPTKRKTKKGKSKSKKTVYVTGKQRLPHGTAATIRNGFAAALGVANGAKSSADAGKMFLLNMGSAIPMLAKALNNGRALRVKAKKNMVTFSFVRE